MLILVLILQVKEIMILILKMKLKKILILILKPNITRTQKKRCKVHMQKYIILYHLTHPRSLLIKFGTFWDPPNLRTQPQVSE